MNAVVLVLIALLFLEGCLFALAPGLVKDMLASVSERTLQLAGLIEAIAALALIMLIYL